MKFKLWEKWYWGIILTAMAGLLIWVAFREKGFVFADSKTGEPVEISKFIVSLWILLNLLPLAFVWLVIRFFTKTNDFICKYCRKEYAGGFETEKEVCKICFKKGKTRKY